MHPAWLLALLLIPTIASAQSPITVTNPKCESQVKPIGLDAPNPRLSWVLRAPPAARNQRQSAYRILVASSAAVLAKHQGDLWDSGVVASAEQNHIAYAGKRLMAGQVCHWKVQVRDGRAQTSAWSAPATWEMGLLAPADWKGQWLNDGKPQPTTDAALYDEDPAPLFRRPFRLARTVKSARLHIAGLGIVEASLNGKRVGDHLLDPTWTRFEKRVGSSTYDVTALLTRSENCLGVTLGNGWYNPLPLKMWGNLNLREHLATGRPRFIAQLHVTYTSGPADLIVSDTNWRVADGPIRRNNLYLGELVDARLEQPGWDTAPFDPTGWRTPGLATEPIGLLQTPPLPPIRITEQWKAIRVTQPKPGVFLYDLGQNFTGWITLDLDVPRGTRVQLRYGELLHADGTLNPMTSVAGQIKRAGVGGPGAPDIAWQADTYIAKGGGETFTPRFTFHAFRYAEITGLTELLPLEAVTAQRLHTDIESAGSFECSNPMLNAIQTMCRRTFVSNLIGVQSDCPHRERFGYGGDIAATSEAFMANYDMSTFYAKTVQDWADSTRPDGMLTDTAPFVGIHYCGVVWAMAHPLLLSQLHQQYGNTQLVRDQYAVAKRWLLFVEKANPTGIVSEGLSDHEGLAPAPAPVMVTPIYYQSARLLASLARTLGETEDAAHFTHLAEFIRAAYLQKHVAAGIVGPGTQASQAFGLASGIVPEANRPAVLNTLLKQIEAKQDHLSTGILGTKFMLDELSRAGQADLAYQIVTQPDFPGWGWMLENGATTLWEHWQLSDNTFSHNHPMFGSVSQWMMQWLGGIQPADDAVGFDKIVIRPQTVKGLDWVKSSHRSIRGEIVSNWRSVGDTVEFEIIVPVNTRAQVTLPGATVTEGGKALEAVVSRDNTVEFTVGSGTYQFVVAPHP